MIPDLLLGCMGCLTRIICSDFADYLGTMAANSRHDALIGLVQEAAAASWCDSSHIAAELPAVDELRSWYDPLFGLVLRIAWPLV